MLSKSKFILGQQCNKSFWFDINNIEPTNPPDEGSLERLNAGNEVGEISKDLFPGGIEIPYLPGDQKKMFPCSILLEGEYGLSDLCIGVPVILGKDGIEKVVEIDLSDAEKEHLTASAEAVKKNNLALEL